MIEPSLAILARKYDNEQRRNGGGKKGNRRGGGNRSRNACDGAGCLAQVGDVNLPGVSNSSLGTSTIGNKRVRGGDLAQQGTSGRRGKGKGLAQVGSEALG